MRTCLPQLARPTLVSSLLLLLLWAPTAMAQPDPDPEETASLPLGSQLMYTTYFYTAAEAVVHGYEPETNVRIVSMNGGATVWTGQVGPGDAVLVPTGAGVFGFLSDKKASILVGTPSTCTVVGYWARDETGSFRSDHFFTRLPATTNYGSERVVLWAWEDTDVTVTDVTADRTLYSGPLAAFGRFELSAGELQGLGAHLLEVRAQSPSVELQVYYDEGFEVPATDGRSAGTDFLSYVGTITEGVNDLNLVSYHTDAQVRVLDINSQETLWEGTVEAGGVESITLADRYVRVQSDAEISVAVAPYAHYSANYAEHHFSMGAEGTGIETSFLLPTTNELWIFSYFDGSDVTVEEIVSGTAVWSGTLGAGEVRGLYPGHGFYRVHATRGVSVQGGSDACGAEFSPAGGLFQVDEALLAAVIDIRQQRIEAAAAEGRELSEDEINAPLDDAELEQAVRRVRAVTASPAVDASAVEERLGTMQTY